MSSSLSVVDLARPQLGWVVPGPPVVLARGHSLGILKLITRHSSRGSLNGPVALGPLVHEVRERDCSKPEDRIIVPLAFQTPCTKNYDPDTADFRCLEMSIPSMLDCFRSTQELYCRFTHFTISSIENLDILPRAHRNDDNRYTDLELSLPSWVPPFHAAGSPSLIDELLFTHYNSAKHLGRRYEGESTKFVRRIPSRYEQIFLGEMNQISKYAAVADSISSWFSSVQNWPSYKTHTEKGRPRDICIYHQSHVRKQKTPGARNRDVNTSKEAGVSNEWAWCFVTYLAEHPVMKGTRWRLFCYDLGQQRLIGLAPALAQERDCICILQGAKVTFIVRRTKQPGRFRLIGDVFAENFMHGRLEHLNSSPLRISLMPTLE